MSVAGSCLDQAPFWLTSLVSLHPPDASSLTAEDRRRGARGAIQRVSRSELFRGQHAHHAPLSVENGDGRDGFVVRAKSNVFQDLFHDSCLPSRKRATEAHLPLPQAGHGPLPISKHVSQSRHSAIRRSGRCNVLSVSLPFMSFTSFGRFDHGTRLLAGQVTSAAARARSSRGWVMDPNGPETIGSASAAPSRHDSSFRRILV